MKKLWMLALSATMVVFAIEANAQQMEIGKNKKVERSEVPIQILKSLENEFPEASGVKDQSWYLHFMEGKGSLTARVYKVVVETDQVSFTGYYRPDGSFEKANETKKHVQLPLAVESTIKADYASWEIVDRNEIISVGRINRDRFEVQMAHSGHQKLIVLSPEGEVLKDRQPN